MSGDKKILDPTEIFDPNEDETDRTPRSVETRDTDARQPDWQQPGLLPTPDPVPGYGFRWVRVSTIGEGDPTNVSLRLREGWVPVKAKDHPELQYFSTQDPKSRWKENVEIGGLILCKIPLRVADQRAKAMRDAADRQMDAVDNSLMRESDPRMPMLKPQRKTQASFGQGRKP